MQLNAKKAESIVVVLLSALGLVIASDQAVFSADPGYPPNITEALGIQHEVNEIAILSSKEVLNKDELKRTRKVLLLNTLNFMTIGAIVVAGTGISINPRRPPTDGNILGSIANGTSILISLAALNTQLSGQSTQHVAIEPNLLSEVIFYDEKTTSSRLTHFLRGYISVRHGNSSESPAEVLLGKWKREKLLSKDPRECSTSNHARPTNNMPSLTCIIRHLT